MNLVKLDYSVRKELHPTFHQKMFGYIHCKRWYIHGILHAVPHYRVFSGRIYMILDKIVDFDPAMVLCKRFVFSRVAIDTYYLFLRTGSERWTFYAKEKGWDIGSG